MMDQKELRSMKKGSIGSKIKQKIYTKCLKVLNNTFEWKIRLPLGPSISN